mmetsp:Transcript_57924/g.141534  ORF Transcript_57924/g.141534 Transcript_57924/m.141534 type:complete len:210 (-) Transcript_57924:116-745(-)
MMSFSNDDDDAPCTSWIFEQLLSNNDVNNNKYNNNAAGGGGNNNLPGYLIKIGPNHSSQNFILWVVSDDDDSNGGHEHRERDQNQERLHHRLMRYHLAEFRLLYFCLDHDCNFYHGWPYALIRLVRDNIDSYVDGHRTRDVFEQTHLDIIRLVHERIRLEIRLESYSRTSYNPRPSVRYAILISRKSTSNVNLMPTSSIRSSSLRPHEI